MLEYIGPKIGCVDSSQGRVSDRHAAEVGSSSVPLSALSFLLPAGPFS